MRTIFKMLMSTKRPHERKTVNLFRNLKLESHIFQVFHSPTPTPETRREQNHPGSQAPPSYSHAQQFPWVNVFNHADTWRNMPILGLFFNALYSVLMCSVTNPNSQILNIQEAQHTEHADRKANVFGRQSETKQLYDVQVSSNRSFLFRTLIHVPSCSLKV